MPMGMQNTLKNSPLSLRKTPPTAAPPGLPRDDPLHEFTAASNRNGNDNNNNSAGLPPSNQQQQLQSQLPPAPRASVVPEQDQYMPIANVIRILPAQAKISDDARETVQECVSAYISFITGEANDRCQREQRKTITAEDFLWAMGKLGFDDYVEPLTVFNNRYRGTERDRTSIRDSILKRGAAVGMDYGTRGMTAYAPMYPPPPAADHAGFYVGAGGFYRDPHGASSSQKLQATNDPFAQFKS